MGRARGADALAALRARPVRRILVVKLRAIGDVLLSTVVLPNLRAAFPDAALHFLTESPARDVVTGNPFLDEAIIFSPRRDSILRLFLKLHRARYDLVFDLFCNPRSAQMTFATGAPVRVGYPFRGRAWAYNVHATPRSDRVHNTEFNLDALAAVGVPIARREVHFPIPEADAAWADAWLRETRRGTGPLVAVNPSGTWETKRWGLPEFAALADRITEAFGAECVLLWGPGEEPDARAIAGAMRNPALVPPRTTLAQLGALLARCDYTVSNDAGPMHISAAVGTPTLGIFGPTNPHLQGPFHPGSAWVRLDSLSCIACNRTSCDIGIRCMRELPVERVFDTFTSLVSRTASTAP
jgi:ADP-heptose:LPS heptosyltransferase